VVFLAKKIQGEKGMAVTRIKANQISDDAVQTAKIADSSVTAGKLEDNLTYGSNLTISGNLTVNGTTTTVDSTTTQVADPLLLLSRGATGSGAVDAGLVIERGDDDNVAVMWDESADEFVVAVTSSEDGTTAGNVTISSYANFQAATVTASALSLTGTLDIDNIRIDGNTISSTDTNGAINLTPNGTGEVVAATLTVSDLTNNRVVIAGTSGALEDDANFTYDGTDLTVNSAIVSDLTATRVTYAGTSGALVDSANMTFDGTDLTVNSAIVSDLTDNRVVIAGTSGALEDDANFTFDGTALALTAGMDITGDLDVDNININGNTIISTDTNGDINLTPNGTGDVVVSTIEVSDLTSGRIVTAGTAGALEDSSTLLWDGTDLTAGSAIISDLTDNRVVIAGTSGALEDDANFTFDGTTITMTAAVDVTGDLDVDNININGNAITSTDTNGAVTVTPNGTGTIDLGAAATVVNINGTTGSSGTGNGALVVDGGVGIAENLNVGGNIVVAGNFTVEGTTTTVDSVTTQVVDPIFQIGGGAGGAALSADDDKDRGMSAKYHTGSEEKTAFWGFDDSTGNWTFVPDATITSEVVSGSKGTLDVGSILNANLTDNRVVIAGTNGVLEDDANFTYDGTDLTVNSAIVGDLTDNRVVIAGTSGALEDDANFTYDGTDLTVNSAIVGDLTDNRIVVAGTSGALEDDANLTWDGSDMGVTGGLNVTGDLAVDNIAINGNTISSTDTNGAINLTPNGTGEVVAATATVSDLTDNRVVIAGTSGALEDDANFTYDGTDLTVNSAIVGDLTSGRIVTAGTSGALEDSSTLLWDGTDLTAGSAIVSDLTAGRVVLAGTSGAIEDSGNLTFDGTTLTVTGNVAVDNITIDGNDITATSGGKVTVNDAGADVDFTVEGDSDTALFHVDAGTDTINIGTTTATTGAKVKISSTESMIIPTGSTAQRPGTGVEGMLRLNSSTYKMEYYANSEWKTADSAFTVIASETFDGDDSTVAFTLSEAQTTASCIVSINGVLQLPVTAYGVSSTTLTFTEAPATGDKIEVRKLTTTTTITEIASSDGYQTVSTVDATGVQISTGTSSATLRWTFDTSGHMIPASDNAYDIGSGSNQVRAIYVSGSTIHLGGLQLKNNSGNFEVLQSDGSTPAAVTPNIVANNSTDETCYLTFVDGATGLQELESDTGLTYNPSSNTLTTSVFSGTATTAQYADLAEMYASDAEIEAGTVVHFAGNGKVAPCDTDMCSKVAGIVSTDPAHLMNSSQEGVPLALAGRVPCKVTGTVNAGDLMVSAGGGLARAEANPALGTVIGKAIEDFSGEGEGVIEVLALMM
jgi:hypothetical protein